MAIEFQRLIEDISPEFEKYKKQKGINYETHLHFLESTFLDKEGSELNMLMQMSSRLQHIVTR